MQDEGYSKAVVCLAMENEAHSDDELDPESLANVDHYYARFLARPV